MAARVAATKVENQLAVLALDKRVAARAVVVVVKQERAAARKVEAVKVNN